MECRCGMEFCYACGGVYNDCECTKREMRLDRLIEEEYFVDEDEKEEIKVGGDQGNRGRVQNPFLSSLVNGIKVIEGIIDRENQERVAAERAKEQAAQRAKEQAAQRAREKAAQKARESAAKKDRESAAKKAKEDAKREKALKQKEKSDKCSIF